MQLTQSPFYEGVVNERKFNSAFNWQEEKLNTRTKKKHVIYSKKIIHNTAIKERLSNISYLWRKNWDVVDIGIGRLEKMVWKVR